MVILLVNIASKALQKMAPPALETDSALSTPVTPTPADAAASQRTKSRFGAESAMSLLVDSLKDRLLLAIPKKGRLMEKTLELLAGGYYEARSQLSLTAGADIKYNRAHRLDVALVQNHPIAMYVAVSSLALLLVEALLTSAQKSIIVQNHTS